MRRILILFLFWLPLMPAAAQGLTTGRDTLRKDSARLVLESLPRKHAIRSAILPGYGQLSNNRWWKVPIIYGGFVTIGVVYGFNQKNYRTFLEEAQYRQANKAPLDPRYTGYSDEGIIRIKDGYRRDRDLSILAGIGWYGLNILDAYIDAKFFRFDISDDISLRVNPTVIPATGTASAAKPAIRLHLSL